ncbi:MAG: hypothetical protein K2G01_03865 [Paramuribaculum sp.]|nr:hypothetical protein [Paramuribaculum sp.]
MEFHLKLIILTTAATAFCSCGRPGENSELTLMEVSKQDLAEAVQERDMLLDMVKEIAVGMSRIKRIEGLATNAATNPQELAQTTSGLLKDLTEIRRLTEERRKLLTEMETKLENSTINNRELHEIIDALRVQLNSQLEEIEFLRRQLTSATRRIGSLNNSVDSLHSTMDSLSTAAEMTALQLEEANRSSATLEKCLNKCYYIVATKKELKSHNLLESGFLRKTKVLPANSDRSYFHISDKRKLTSLPTGSKKASVLTSHPAGSYEIADTEDGKRLDITDPGSFWSLTDYLIIQTD